MLTSTLLSTLLLSSFCSLVSGKAHGGVVRRGSHEDNGNVFETTIDLTYTRSAEKSKYTEVKYGSGSTPNRDLDDCVMQCRAKFGLASSAASAPAATQTAPTETVAPSATGTKTHTIIVAPTKGVLRFVPFSVDAQPGDTLKYVWGAGPHTVTKSSGVALCNATLDGTGFTSGRQNASFEFDKVVNDTSPLFFFCGIPGHCTKGMFSIVNPATLPTSSAQGSNGSFDAAITTLASSSPVIATMMEQVKAIVGQDTAAWAWGGSIDVTGMSGDKLAMLADNILYTRAAMALNPSMAAAGDWATAGFQVPQLGALAVAAAPAASTAAATSTAPLAPASSDVSSAGLASGGALNSNIASHAHSSLGRPAGAMAVLGLASLAFLLL